MNIFDIQHASMVDGPGIRTTVFFKGCNLKCAWCHNPESQLPESQMMFFKDKCTGCGKCAVVCPYSLKECDLCGKCELYCPQQARKVCGRKMSVEEVLKEILADKTFYDNSGGGVTFSGGECMLQVDFLYEILKKCRENGIHTAVDTAGNVPWANFEKILPFTDMFLYDVKSMNIETHKKYVGTDNRLILDNLKKLLDKKACIWIRVPVIRGVNDSLEEMILLKAFFCENGFPEKVEILPYHSMGEGKYLALGRKPPEFEAPYDDVLCLFREAAVKYNIQY